MTQNIKKKIGRAVIVAVSTVGLSSMLFKSLEKDLFIHKNDGQSNYKMVEKNIGTEDSVIYDNKKYYRIFDTDLVSVIQNTNNKFTYMIDGRDKNGKVDGWVDRYAVVDENGTLKEYYGIRLPEVKDSLFVYKGLIVPDSVHEKYRKIMQIE